MKRFLNQCLAMTVALFVLLSALPVYVIALPSDESGEGITATQEVAEPTAAENLTEDDGYYSENSEKTETDASSDEPNEVVVQIENAVQSKRFLSPPATQTRGAYATPNITAADLNYTTYTESGSTKISVTGYKGAEIDLVFPEEIDGVAIGKIAANAFENNSAITSIVLPNGLIRVEKFSFRNCDMLTSVVLPDSVTFVGDLAFENCDQLQSVSIGSGLYDWGVWCFANNPKLTNLTFADGLLNIGRYYTYDRCSDNGYAVMSAVDNTAGYYKYYDIYMYKYQNDGSLYTYTGNNYSWNYLDMPGAYGSAFMGCTALTSVTIPDSVTTIWQGAFAGCSKLTSVNFGSDLNTIGNYAFYGCSALTSAGLPADLVTIGIGAFQDCSKLGSVAIPSTVTNIYQDAYKNCVAMTTASTSNANIGANAFQGCLKLQTLVMGNGATSIGDYAFNGDLRLSKVTFGRSLKTIGQYAFNGCSALKTVTLTNAVTTVGDFAFQNCSALQNFTTGNGTQTIGNSAFVGCSSLASVTLSNSVQTVGEYAFNGCAALTTLTIGNSVKTIGKFAFRNCDMLTSVVIPDSVTFVGDLAFENCDQLQSVFIGSGLYDWGIWCFANNPKLTNLTFADGLLNIGRYCTYNSDSIRDDEYVITSAVDSTSGCYPYYNIHAYKYQTDGSLFDISNNGSYRNFKYLDYPGSFGSAFIGCTALTSVTIPDSVTTIWQGAFNGCTALENVVFGEDLSIIGNYAFYNCSKLTTVTLPEYINTVGMGAFQNSGLTTVRGVENTYAQTYANSNGYTFEDINGVETFTVTFVNYNGVILKLDEVRKGEAATAPAAPSRNGYEFTGWDKSFTNVTEDLTVTAQFRQIISVAGVTLSDDALNLSIGDQFTLVATVLPENAENKNVTWTSSDAAIATVTENGLVKAVAAGSAVITVKTNDGNYIATCSVTVTDSAVVLIKGDVNNDGVVDAADAIMIQKYDAGLIQLTATQLTQGDVSGDGIVDAADAILVLKFDAGLINAL